MGSLINRVSPVFAWLAEQTGTCPSSPASGCRTAYMMLALIGLLAASQVGAQPAEVSAVMTKAIEDRDGKPGTPAMPAAVGSLWRFEGPTNLRNGNRNDSGRINEIAIHPGNPRIMFATGATGGVWKTT